jgi:hypothetical protein
MTMATVSLKNISGRMLSLVLTGAHLGHTKHKPAPIKLVTVHHAKNGQMSPRVRHVPMAQAIRIPAGESLDVDDAVAHCPDVKAAVARRALRVETPKPEPVPDGTKPDKKDDAKAEPTAPTTTTNAEKNP